MVRTIIFSITCILFLASNVFADAVHLKNGNKISGVITKEDDDSVEIKINIGAAVTFSKKDIDTIERSSEAEQAEILDRWQSEKTQKELGNAQQELFEQEQMQKDLVKHGGEWVTPQEKERLQASAIAKDVDKEGAQRRFLPDESRVDKSSFAEKLLAKGKWFVKETEHFSVYYTDLSKGKIVSDKAEYYFEKIAYDFAYEDQIKWNKKCQVYIVESVERWRDFLEDIRFNPELVGGFVPNYGEKEMFLCVLSDAYLAVTFPHELTHLIFRDIAGTNTIPLWLNEGIANYEASVTSISTQLLIKRIKQGRHILLGDLLSMASYPAGKELRELFYSQSEKLVEFLITQYGREKFRKFCDLILKDKSFKDSLFSVYKEDFKDIEDFNIKLVEYIVK